MTRQEIVYDIITILKKAGYTDDDALDEDYIGYKIDEGRAKEIRDSYNRNPTIDPAWVQDYGVTDLTRINFADDKTLTHLQCDLSKVTLPPLVSFSNSMSNINNLGIVAMLSATGKTEFHYMPYSQMMMEFNKLSDSNVYKKFQYYSVIGNSVYVLGKHEKLRPLLVLSRPLDGFVMSTENVLPGDLIIGTSYTVMNAQVVHNSIAYGVGSIFTAAVKTYTGPGTVQYTNQKRAMTNEDEYPFSNSQAQTVIIKLLTQEFRLQMAQITDIRNDSQDPLKVLQPVAP